jgi:hypothetical protein
MNMPVRSGALIHQVMCEYPKAASLDDFVEALESNDFLIVEEFYKDVQSGSYYSAGMIAINHRHIGKIRAINEKNPQFRD